MTPTIETETKRGATCDMCGRSYESGPLFSFLGKTWIKLHGSCLSWMGLALSQRQADERAAKSRPVLRIVKPTSSAATEAAPNVGPK